jgi:hypothetical protein
MNKAQVSEAILMLAREAVGSGDEGKSLQAKNRDFVEAVILARSIGKAKKVKAKAKTAEDPREVLTQLGSLSPMQTRVMIDKIVAVRQEIQKMAIKFAAELAIAAQVQGLEKEEADGLDALKEVIKELKLKGRFLTETEDNLLEWAASVERKRPGIQQMVLAPEKAPEGGRAGELFDRIAKKLGDEVANQVETIYRETYEDLTKMVPVVRNLKILSKSAPVKEAALRQAGLSDIIVGVKTWLSGAADSMTRRLTNFMGNIAKWVKGFKERTLIVKNSSGKLGQLLKEADAELNKALA